MHEADVVDRVGWDKTGHSQTAKNSTASAPKQVQVHSENSCMEGTAVQVQTLKRTHATALMSVLDMPAAAVDLLLLSALCWWLMTASAC
jgi:hypothetical protein